MESHFSVVWFNFEAQDEFNRKILTDVKNFRASAKKTIFRRNCKPWIRLHWVVNSTASTNSELTTNGLCSSSTTTKPLSPK